MTKLNFRILLMFIAFWWIMDANLLAQTCTTGTLLYREDFRGNNVSDPMISPIDLIGGYSQVPFFPTGVGISSGMRSLQKNTSNVSAGVGWWNTDDHTSFGDPNRGYAMYIDPAANQMNAILYQMQIADLCAGATLSLSVWAADIATINASPKMQLEISNAATNAVLAQSPIITLRRSTTQAAFGYNQYSLQMTMPVGVNAVKLTIINKETIALGNDWVMDDIEVRFCTNTVNATAKSSAAVDVPITSSTRQIPFTGSFVNDAKFGASLASYWIYSLTGDITDLTNWTVLDTKPAATIANGAIWNHDFTLLNPKIGYYRLVIGNPANVLTSKCRAASEVFHVHK